MNVFYSWQSALVNKFNRNFIKECLKQAIKVVYNDLELDEAIRLDQDTKGIPGSPDIANTIYKKIRKSDVFVADVSFISKTESGKLNPNPNVLIELGYDLSSLSDICIVNDIDVLVSDSYQGNFNDPNVVKILRLDSTNRIMRIFVGNLKLLTFFVQVCGGAGR